jgi:hypothetical protein
MHVVRFLPEAFRKDRILPAIACLAVLLVIPGRLHPQDIIFEQSVGYYYEDFGNSVEQTADGGYVIAGALYFLRPGDIDVLLVRVDPTGNLIRLRAYGGIETEVGNAVRQTVDGGYVICGYANSSGAGDYDFYLVRTDANTDTLWTKTYGDSLPNFGTDVELTLDGGYILTGYSESSGPGNADVVLIKTDALGNLTWENSYGGDSSDVGECVQQTSDGGYVVVGTTRSFGAGLEDVYLIKTDPSGHPLWSRTYGGSEDDWGRSVEEADDDGYFIAGGTRSSGAGASDVYLLRTDASGSLLWSKTFGDSGNDEGNSIDLTSDGGCIIAGETKSSGGMPDIYLIKTDASGGALWTWSREGYAGIVGRAVRQTADGGYIVAGDGLYSGASGRALFNRDVYYVKVSDPFTGIEEPSTSSPSPRAFGLAQNYPNPFNPVTTIGFHVPGDESEKRFVHLAVFDLRGRHVTTLVDSELEPGEHRVVWDGKNARGERVPSGIYMYTLRCEEETSTRKMVLLR